MKRNPKRKTSHTCTKCGALVRCQKVWHPIDGVTARTYVCKACGFRERWHDERVEVYQTVKPKKKGSVKS